MCSSRKVVYQTLRGAAEAALDQLSAVGPRRAYLCDECDRYHLTSQPLGRAGQLTSEMVRALAAAVGAREVK